MKNNKELSNRNLVLIAFYSALYVVADITVGHIMGGEFAHVFPKLIILIASYHLGYRQGFYVALVTVVLDLVMGHAHMEAGIFGIILDYLVVYGAHGLASRIPNAKNIYTGIIFANAISLVATMLSRMIAFKLGPLSSFILVAPSIIFATVLGLILVPLVVERLKKITSN